jgi:hypothetical protein
MTLCGNRLRIAASEPTFFDRRAYHGGCMSNFADGIDAESLRLEGQGRRSAAPLKIVGSEMVYL